MTSSAHHRFVLPVIVMSQFFCTSVWFAGNTILPHLVRDLPPAPSLLAHMTSAIQFGFITGTFVFAVLSLADRYSPSSVFFTSSVFAGLFNLGLAFTGVEVNAILLFRFLTGFFLAGIYPVGMKLASDYYQEGLGKSLGFLVGALVAGTALPHLLHDVLDGVQWKYIVYVTTAFCGIGGLAVWMLIPNGPYRRSGQRVTLTSYGSGFRRSHFRSVAFGYFGHMWELYTFWMLVPVMISTYHELHPETSFNIHLLSFCIIGSGSLACVLSGALSRRYGVKKLAFVSLCISCGCCLLSPVLLTVGPPWLMISFLVLWGIFVIADSPLFSTLVAQHAPAASRGASLTIVNCIGFAITIVSIQLIQWVSGHIPYPWANMFLAIGPVLGLLASRKPDIEDTRIHLPASA